MSSKNDDHSTTGNVPNIVEMLCTDGRMMLHVWCQGSPNYTCTKNVAEGQWYMDKMKMQDMQLMQASGDTMSTVGSPQVPFPMCTLETLQKYCSTGSLLSTFC